MSLQLPSGHFMLSLSFPSPPTRSLHALACQILPCRPRSWTNYRSAADDPSVCQHFVIHVLSQDMAVEFPSSGSLTSTSNLLLSFSTQLASSASIALASHGSSYLMGSAAFGVNSLTLESKRVILPRLADVANDVTQLFRAVHSRACACSAPTSPNVSSDPRPPQRARLHGHISWCQLLPVTRPHLRPSGAPTMGGRFAAWLRRSAHIQAHRRSTTLLLRSASTQSSHPQPQATLRRAAAARRAALALPAPDPPSSRRQCHGAIPHA